jgi:hypothetical protein
MNLAKRVVLASLVKGYALQYTILILDTLMCDFFLKLDSKSALLYNLESIINFGI